jgi:hypothetical protein
MIVPSNPFAKSTTTPASTAPKTSFFSSSLSAAPPELPAALAKMTVRAALDELERRRDARLLLFKERVQDCRTVERSIYKCLSLIIHLQSEIDTVSKAEEILRKTAEELSNEQKSFLESELKAQTGANRQGREASGSLNKRLGLYRLAGHLREECTKMRAEFEEIRSEPGEDGEKENGERNEEEPRALIQKIANHHLTAIVWMDSELDEARKELEKLKGQIVELKRNSESELRAE